MVFLEWFSRSGLLGSKKGAKLIQAIPPVDSPFLVGWPPTKTQATAKGGFQLVTVKPRRIPLQVPPRLDGLHLTKMQHGKKVQTLLRKRRNEGFFESIIRTQSPHGQKRGSQ